MPTISATVHPHACGEHVLNYLDRSWSIGSSPRLWGTRRSRRSIDNRDRFIPTPVGNTLPNKRQPAALSVHPHACGEHPGSTRSGSRYFGSSPRLWGTLDHYNHAQIRSRFIPTPVGNTLPSDLSDRAAAVHPHACGEHVPLVMPLGIHNGSSPRLWGTHYPAALALPFARFIPTPVGNTFSQDIRGVTIAVHPHACGEHNPSHRLSGSAGGSSPRLWGTHSLFYRATSIHRFIPTPVGNTLP